MELRHLRYFITVAEELHFGRAASRLNIAQPPLSQQIRQLENELGFPLLYRNKHRVELTEAGKVFLEECRFTWAYIEKAKDSAERAHRGATGRLEIGFVGSVTYNIVPILQRYRLRFPCVNLRLHQMKSAHQLQALYDGRIHLAVVRSPIRSPFLETKIILREKFVAALPEKHPLANCSILRVQDLAGEDFIVPSRNNGSNYRDAVFNLCCQSGFRPNISIEAPEILTIVAFVSESMGVAFVPASFQNQTNIGVVYRELDKGGSSLEMSFVWRKDEKSQVLQQFLHMIDELTGPPKEFDQENFGGSQSSFLSL